MQTQTATVSGLTQLTNQLSALSIAKSSYSQLPYSTFVETVTPGFLQAIANTPTLGGISSTTVHKPKPPEPSDFGPKRSQHRQIRLLKQNPFPTQHGLDLELRILSASAFSEKTQQDRQKKLRLLSTYSHDLDFKSLEADTQALCFAVIARLEAKRLDNRYDYPHQTFSPILNPSALHSQRSCKQSPTIRDLIEQSKTSTILHSCQRKLAKRRPSPPLRYLTQNKSLT